MYKGLLRTLTYMYQFVTLGRERMSKDEMQGIANAADTIATRAPEILEPEDGGSLQQNKIDLEQAAMVDQHIIEMVQWLINLEIV